MTCCTISRSTCCFTKHGWNWARCAGGVLLMHLLWRKDAAAAPQDAGAASAGLPVTPGVTPMALASLIRSERAAAGRPAERIVDLYLRARYGKEDLGESDMRELGEALGAARRHLGTVEPQHLHTQRALFDRLQPEFGRCFRGPGLVHRY